MVPFVMRMCYISDMLALTRLTARATDLERGILP
jgi:hypothetical protein